MNQRPPGYEPDELPLLYPATMEMRRLDGAERFYHFPQEASRQRLRRLAKKHLDKCGLGINQCGENFLDQSEATTLSPLVDRYLNFGHRVPAVYVLYLA